MAVVDVFVSHAGRDRPWAEWVAWQLDRAGLSVELDYWAWKAGENFVARMSEALRSCKVMVALFSEAEQPVATIPATLRSQPHSEGGRR